MREIVAIDFACNDPDNGVFAGQAMMATYGDAEIEAPAWKAFRFTDGDGWVRIHRRKFKVIRCKTWFGNWCWNRYWLKRSEAKRLLATLREKGWRCTCGPSRIYAWFNAGASHAAS